METRSLREEFDQRLQAICSNPMVGESMCSYECSQYMYGGMEGDWEGERKKRGSDGRRNGKIDYFIIEK